MRNETYVLWEETRSGHPGLEDCVNQEGLQLLCVGTASGFHLLSCMVAWYGPGQHPVGHCGIQNDLNMAPCPQQLLTRGSLPVGTEVPPLPQWPLDPELWPYITFKALGSAWVCMGFHTPPPGYDHRHNWH